MKGGSAGALLHRAGRPRIVLPRNSVVRRATRGSPPYFTASLSARDEHSLRAWFSNVSALVASHAPKKALLPKNDHICPETIAARWRDTAREAGLATGPGPTTAVALRLRRVGPGRRTWWLALDRVVGAKPARS